MLRGNGTESLFRRHQEHDWRVGAGEPVRLTTTEAGLGGIEQVVQIGWPPGAWYMGNI